MIPQSTIMEILETARVEEVVGDFVNLKKSGANLFGLCPFHNEKTPSFSVAPSKNIFKCFGCGRGGDSVAFVMEHESYSYPEALRYLADKYNIEIVEKERTPQERAEDLIQDALYSLYEYANKQYIYQLHHSDEGQSVGLTYMEERGLLKSTLEKFQLGYSPQRGNLIEQLKKMGYKDELLRQAGLTNSAGYEFFRNRIIFPIHNVSGKTVAFAGRILGKNKSGPKYLNSPESEIYIKNKLLYGMHLAKSEIRKADKCYLVEGYMDVISMHQNGIKNVVASSGTSLTTNQVGLIHRFTDNATILYDGDQAGINAALRGVEIMLEADLNVKIVLFPEGQDPDSYLSNHGQSSFIKYIEENEKDFILFMAGLRLKAAAHDPIKRSAFVSDILGILSHVEDPIKRSAYMQELSALSGMQESILVNELNKKIKKKLWNKRKRVEAEERRSSRSAAKKDIDDFVQGEGSKPEIKEHYKERDLIRILMCGGDKSISPSSEISITQYILESLQKENEYDLRHPLYHKIMEEILLAFDNNQLLSIKYFLGHADKDVRDLALEFAEQPYTYSENWEKRWNILLQTQESPENNYHIDSIQALLRHKLERIIMLSEQNLSLLKTLEDDTEIENHLRIQQELDNDRIAITRELRTIIMP